MGGYGESAVKGVKSAGGGLKDGVAGAGGYVGGVFGGKGEDAPGGKK